MNQFKLLCCFLLLASPLLAQDEQDVNNYIERFRELAIKEQLRSGIPAAITLAQGIHESAAGKSELATIGNNHFGIKCKSNWEGETMAHDDDARQECFRKYPSAEQSYLDHSDFLKSSNRYHFLFDIELTDYHGWSSGLKRAGYATNPAYVKRLDDVIEKYNLQQYTYEGIQRANQTPGEIIPSQDKPATPLATNTSTTSPAILQAPQDAKTYYKGLKGFWANKGDMLLSAAMEKNIRYAKLLALNDLSDAPLENKMFIFTEKKRKIGTEEFHTVKIDENMLLIAQREAIQLDQLLTYNNLINGQEPEVGEKIYLQYASPRTPQLRKKFLASLENDNRQAVTASNENNMDQSRIQEEKVVEVEPLKVIEEKVVEPKADVEIKEAEPVVENRSETKPTEQNDVVQEPTPAKEVVVNEPTTPLVEEPRDASTAAPTASQNIIDVEKAKRVDALLNTEPLNENAKPQPTLEEVIQAEPKVAETPMREAPVVVTEKEVVVAVAQEPKQVAPTYQERSYNDKDVNDSTKSLKKKFDRIVYSPKPPRRVDTVKKVDTPIKKETIPAPKKEIITKESVTPKKETTTATKKANDKTDTKKTTEKKEVEKKSSVTKTKDGIKRDLKKETEKESAKKEDKKEVKKNVKTNDKKESADKSKKDKSSKEKDSKDKKEDTKKTSKKESPSDKKKKETDTDKKKNNTKKEASKKK